MNGNGSERMKKQHIFPAMIFITFGTYFALQQGNINLFTDFFSWPTLLFLVGISFLFQGYGGKDYDAIIPGVIFAGLGIHFHFIQHFNLWSDSPGIFLLIIALAFLLFYQKTGEGLIYVLFFLIVSVILLFYKRISEWLGVLESGTSFVLKFWPFLFIGYGIYLIIKRKR